MDRSVAHDALNREQFALRRAEQEAVAAERELERRLADFQGRVELVQDAVDEEFRREHWGRQPPRRTRGTQSS